MANKIYASDFATLLTVPEYMPTAYYCINAIDCGTHLNSVFILLIDGKTILEFPASIFQGTNVGPFDEHDARFKYTLVNTFTEPFVNLTPTIQDGFFVVTAFTDDNVPEPIIEIEQNQGTGRFEPIYHLDLGTCPVCPAGTCAPCAACPAGTCPEAVCPAGTCSPCAACPEGTCSPCAACPEGTCSPCVACPSGTCPEAVCPAGTCSPCAACPEGTCFPCAACPEGTCSPFAACPEGTCSPCAACPAGTCAACPAGTCPVCPAGTCPVCPAGTCPVCAETVCPAGTCPVCPAADDCRKLIHVLEIYRKKLEIRKVDIDRFIRPLGWGCAAGFMVSAVIVLFKS